jgi:hypothetical protein
MVAGNLPKSLPSHAEAMVELAKEMITFVETFSAETGHKFIHPKS